ncbi:MAG: hypothetical protein AAF514_07540, partial [Verrucomicrobiota bacterium]
MKPPSMLSPSGWVWWVMMAIACISLLMVIQKDRPLGTKAFWPTRPIGKGVVLGSKSFCFSVLVILLWVTFLLPPVLTHSSNVVLPLAGMFFAKSLPVLGIVAILGVISAGLSDAVRNLIILGVVAIVVLNLLGVLENRGVFERELDARASASLLISAMIVAGGAGLSAVQYFFRSWSLGMVLTFGLFVAGILLFVGWKRDFLTQVLSEQREESLGLESVTIELADGGKEWNDHYMVTPGSENGVPRLTLRAPGMISSLPEGLGMRDMHVEGKIVSTDSSQGGSVESRRGWTVAPVFLPAGDFSGYRFLGSKTETEERIRGRWVSPGVLDPGGVDFANVKRSNLEFLEKRELAFEGMAELEV